MKRNISTLPGLLLTLFVSVLILAGFSTPTGNLMTTDVNGGGHSLTNAATLSATNYGGPGTNAFDAAGAAATAQTNAITFSTNYAGTNAVKYSQLPVGTTSSHVAAGDDSRIVNATPLSAFNGLVGNFQSLGPAILDSFSGTSGTAYAGYQFFDVSLSGGQAAFYVSGGAPQAGDGPASWITAFNGTIAVLDTGGTGIWISNDGGNDYTQVTLTVHKLTGTLSGGSATVTVPSGVAPWVQNTNTASMTNVGPLSVSVSGTTATVKSSNASDTSTFNLFYWQ